MMKAPGNYEEALALLKSGDLRLMIKLQMILTAFSSHDQVGLRALIELWSMPEDAVEDFLDPFTDDELKYVKKLLDEMIEEMPNE